MRDKVAYRFETKTNKKGITHTYLVRDIQVKGKKTKIYVPIDPSIQITESNSESVKEQYKHKLLQKAIEKLTKLSASSYTSSYTPLELMSDIELVRNYHIIINKYYTISELNAYERDFEIHYVHGTTVIEGNTLTYQEVGQVLEYGINPTNKNLREINEVQNFKQVKKYRDSYSGKISIKFIKRLHELIMHNIDIESAGSFRRTDDIRILGTDIMPTPSILIEEELKRIINEFYTNLQAKRYPFELIILFHYQFEIIHPFSDGNGRVGREILNYLLSMYEYPKMLFPGKYRQEYIKALNAGNHGDYTLLIFNLANLLLHQYSDKLQENLKIVINPIEKDEQSRLVDFFTD